MSDQLEKLDYYTLLGVDPGVSIPDVRKAFRKFARRYHPDRFAGGDPDKIARASQIYRRGSEALQVLADPVSRRAYDRALKAGKRRLTADDAERAQIRQRAAAAPKKDAPPIRSPQAEAYYRKAADAARSGRWRDAWKGLKAALEIEPNNPLIESRLAQVEARIRSGRA